MDSWRRPEADSEFLGPRPVSHVPVLAETAIELLQVKAGGAYMDCTAGAGGHAALIAKRLSGGRLIALDRDPAAVAAARVQLAQFPEVEVLHGNYGELAQVLTEVGISWLDGMLIDAGMSSLQLDDSTRGFSFQEDGFLDMRMDTTQGRSASEYLAEVSEEELARVLRVYGDLGPARRIARSIVQSAEREPVRTTGELVRAVAEGLGCPGRIPDETRTVFQAIRIALNDELRWLEAGLDQGLNALASGGRLVVISFHSGEDRIVKNVLRDASRPRRVFWPDGRLKETVPERVRLLTPKPIRPDAAECRRNPRSRSAKLRAVERIAENTGFS